MTVEDTPEDESKAKSKRISTDAHRLARMERYAYLQDGKNEF